MNRIQFFVLTGLSSLVVLLLLGHILLVRETNYQQNQLVAAQQVINQGQAAANMLRQVAMKIVSDAQTKNDQGLKDLLQRQQITFTPNGQAEPTTGGGK